MLLLVRHGRTAANAGGLLAGWTPGIGLDDTGRAQAAALAQRLAAVPISLAVSSPLQRCQETAAAVLAVPYRPAPVDGVTPRARAAWKRPELITDDRLGECKYGDWTNRPLRELAKEPLWRVVQAHPSAAVFPGEGGESMLDMQHRAVAAIRPFDARVGQEFGDDAVWAAFSHGDVIKSILADALGMHFDSFQRLVVDPASVSVIRFTPLRPFAVRINDSDGELASLAPPIRRKTRSRKPTAASSDAVVGGSTGAATGPAPSSPASGTAPRPTPRSALAAGTS